MQKRAKTVLVWLLQIYICHLRLWEDGKHPGLKSVRFQTVMLILIEKVKKAVVLQSFSSMFSCVLMSNNWLFKHLYLFRCLRQNNYCLSDIADLEDSFVYLQCASAFV